MSELAELRRASEGLEPERVLDALDRTLSAWRAPRSLWRARLRRDQPLFSPEVIDAGITDALDGWTREALEGLRARELGPGASAPGVTALWLAGAIPPATFQAMLLPLLAGSAIYVKPAAADPRSPRLFAESLRAADPELARAVHIGSDESALGEADAVVVYGRDETIAELRARVPVHTTFVGYGHKLSVAAVGRDASLESAARRIAYDVALYDGRGCLSPAYLFAEDEPRGRAAELGARLAQELGRAARELPRGALSPAEQAFLQDVRAGLAARDDTQLHVSKGSLAWSVVVSEFREAPPVPGQLRYVPLIPFRELDGLAAWLPAFAPHLSTLARDGFGARDAELVELARRAGASRLCPLGRMQCPPLDWHHDGRPPLAPLLRWLDVEPATVEPEP